MKFRCRVLHKLIASSLVSLQYTKKQIGILEDGLRKSWAKLRSSENDGLGKLLGMGGFTFDYDHELRRVFVTFYLSVLKLVCWGVIKCIYHMLLP